MQPKNKAAIAVAFAQLGIQIARIFHTRQQAQRSQPGATAKRSVKRASGKALDVYAKLPHQKRRAKKKQRTTALVAGGAVVGLGAAAASFLSRRRPAELPSGLEVVKQEIKDKDVVTAVSDGVVQSATNVAAGTSSTAAAVSTIAKVAAHEKVIDPAIAKAKHYTILGVAGLAVLVLVVSIIGAALGMGLYEWLS